MNKSKWLLAVLVLVPPLGGCFGGSDDGMSDDEREAAMQRKLYAIKEVAQLAERHGVAWCASLSGEGRGSVGMSTDFYIETGVDMQLMMFGNAGLQHKRAEDIETEDVLVEEIDQSVEAMQPREVPVE